MIKPINKNVLVEKVLQESKTKSGIIVNTDEKEEEILEKSLRLVMMYTILRLIIKLSSKIIMREKLVMKEKNIS